MDKEIANDPALAGNLLVQGATAVFLNVPRGTEFGIDLCSWHTDKNFKGFKMIPPGIHFLYYSACSKEGETAPRTGFFYNFKSKAVIVKKYDAGREEVVDFDFVDISEDQRQYYLRDFDKHLGPYPYELWKDWISLTSHISEDLLEKLLPNNRLVLSAAEYIRDTSPDSESASHSRIHRSLDDLLPKMIQKPGTEIQFSKFPLHCYPEGSSANEISKHSMDQTYNLEQILKRYNEPTDILGELQLAFICFIVGQVYEAFEQWQKFFQLLCSCDDALEARPQLFSDFITLIHFQLGHLPEEMFVDIVTKTNFLTTTLQVFFSNLETSKAPQELISKGKRFQTFLTKKFKWDFDVEPDDCAPVVVEVPT
ncbi:a1-alpha2 repression [Chamberlinius hualienensis]